MPEFIIVGNSSHECENATELNEQYLASHQFLRPYYGLMIGLTLTNSLLNFTCLLAFRSMRPRRRFNFLLARLSMVESLFQAAFFCNQVLVLSMDSNRLLLPNRHLALCAAALLPISLFLCTALHVARNWAVVLIGRHRWLAVARSDRPTVENAGSARDCRLLAGGLALCALVALPRLFELQPVVCEPDSHVTHVDPGLNGSPAYRLAYLGSLLCLFQNAGPILCLAFFSLDLARRLARQSRRRLSVLGCQNSRRSPWSSGNRTVLLLCLLFCLCEWPTLLKSLDPATAPGQVVGFAANLLTCLDSSLNILVYNCSHKGFGQALADLLYGCFCRCRGGIAERRRARSRSLTVVSGMRRQSKLHQLQQQQQQQQQQQLPLTTSGRDPSIELLSA